jgi:hypothetical protein
VSGEELHALYREKLAELGVESDTWEHLDETDRDAWNATADEIRERYLPDAVS